MGAFLDRVPFSGIIRIRDLMFNLTDPFRLDQGDVSFASPDSVKDAMMRAIRDNHTHYVQTTGVPRLRELLAAKLRDKNGIPGVQADEVLVTTGGIHALYMLCQALLEPGDEVIVPDPEWPPCPGNVVAAGGTPVPCPLRESLGWRYDLDELASKISPRTRAIYVNSPQNPTGGMLTRDDLAGIAALAERHNLTIISDEAYEDIVFDGASHVSIASFPGFYGRVVPFYTFSKSYAMTGLRLGYVAVKDPVLRDRMKKVLFYTASNIASVVQYGGIGALEGPQDVIDAFRTELGVRRDLFHRGVRAAAADVLSGAPAAGAFYAFLRLNADWCRERGWWDGSGSPSWAFTEHLIKHAKIGCVPGVDFGANGEGYVRFCFARERHELSGALASMQTIVSESVATR